LVPLGGMVFKQTCLLCFQFCDPGFVARNDLGKEMARAAEDCLLYLPERIDIAPAEIRVTLSAEAIAEMLSIGSNRIDAGRLTITTRFHHRKRGVETRLIIGDVPDGLDETLLRNIGRAYRYFDMIRSGRTFGEIAEAENLSKRRVQHLIELAFLAPPIIALIQDGKQPSALTSDWLIRHSIPPSGPISASRSTHSEGG